MIELEKERARRRYNQTVGPELHVSSFEEVPDGFTDDELSKAEASYAKILVKHLAAARHYRLIEPFQIMGGLAGLAAAIIFIWNIIWHIGHWIWMGRETR